ncbi:MAG: hypothetical protein HZB53_08720 [Chloroflexi bacterium]|nr:hypothetical protein [Chloroflexota bacterium]
MQSLDAENDRARKQALDLEAKLTGNTEVMAALAAEQRAVATLQVKRAALRERESDMKSLETRMADLEQKLYGGRIQNPKELGSYERELHMFKQNHGRIEEAVLSLMDETDQAERDASAAREAREAAESVRAHAGATWREELDLLRAQIVERDEVLRALRRDASVETLDFYDRLRKRMPTSAAPVRHGGCAACGIGLSADVVERAHAEDEVAVCDNCGRILYVG